MRKTIVLGAVLVLLQIPLLAYVLLQERTWGGPSFDAAHGVAVAPDGSVYVTGSTVSFGATATDEDAFLLKYTAGGALLWQRTYGTPADDVNAAQESGADVAVPPDNSGVVVLGNTRDGNIFLTKFTTDGNAVVWARTWGSQNEGAGAIAIGPTGTIYVTGTSDVAGGGGDAFLLSFSAAGTLNWQRTWGGELFERGLGVAVATDGGIFITGDAQSFGANAAYLVKFAADGSVVWEREWGVVGARGGPEDDSTVAAAVAAAPGGGAYVVGDTGGTGFNPNLVAVQFDAAGNFVWQRVGGPGFGTAQDVAVGSDGRVHITGNVLPEDGVGGGDAFVWSLLANGKASDAAVWGGDDQFQAEVGESIAIAPGGALVVAGIAGESPYTFARGSRNAKAAPTFLEVVNGSVTPALGKGVGVSDSVLNLVVGSETFAGVSDAFLLRLQQ